MADEQSQNVTVTIDGIKLSVPKGTLLVEAAKQIQTDIPVYCYHTKLGPAGLCRICLVQVEGMPKLQIGCNTPCTDGMVVHTANEKVDDGRRAVLEFLLLNHPLDCPICDKGGECDLQDFSMAYGQGASRLAEQKSNKPKAIDLGPTIVLDEERCIVCQRCVRFDDLITREQSLVVKDRGQKDIIATATGEPYRSNFSGNVTEICPVGALTSKTYRFKSRPWDLHRTKSSCTQCSVGCQFNVDQRGGTILRTMSNEADDAISDWWLCDRGRYNIGYAADERRLTMPLYKQDGQWMQIGWEDAFALWAKALKDAGGAAGVLGGGRLLNEETYLLQHVFRAGGIHNLDWRAGRQRQATPGRNAGSLVDLETAQAIIVVGQSPAETAPVMDLRIRKAVFRNGAKLIALGCYEPKTQIARTTVQSVAEAIKELPPGATRIAVVWDGVDAALGKELAGALPQNTTLLAYIPGEQNNARGAEALGMHPAFGPGFAKAATVGSDFAGMLDDARSGKLRALSILGANPVLNGADGTAVREALEKIPFIVVSDLFMTQTAELATLVLPACAHFEKSGTTMNLAGTVLPVQAAKDRPDGTLTDLEMLVGLAEALGVTLPSAEDLEHAVIKAVANARLEFTLGDEAVCGVLRQAQHDKGGAQDDKGGGLRVIAQSRIFSGGGTVAHDRSIEMLRPLPEAAISAATARKLGVSQGDCIDLESGGRTMHDLLVEVREDLADDVVVLIAGLPDDPANLLGANAVASACNVRSARDLEPVSAR